jgi:hypothetical protein
MTNVTFLLISEKNWRTRSEIKLLLDENFIFVVIQDEQFFNVMLVLFNFVNKIHGLKL